MNFLKRSKAELEAQTIQRNRILLYKRMFGSKDGREVLTDLMSEFHTITEHDGSQRQEGQRSVVLYIMRQTGMNIQEFDRLWRGEEESA